MYQLKSLEDTIVAISTPAGAGGIGMVRLSGQQAIAIAEKMFVAKDQKKISQMKNFTVHYGHIVKGEEVLDEVLLTVMRSPRSYTREDVIEISCHGGYVVLKAILTLAMDLGARLAEPGEFTKRAFLNGRIDLTQAEAVLDIVQSKTDAFLKVSTHQLKGELTAELEAIRELLMSVYTQLEAIINFPEDDINAEGIQTILQSIRDAGKRVEVLLKSGEEGKILKEGIKIVLCGKPNVGKSSLLNVFLRTPRAIVSHIAGTTRDTIEETAQINGIPLQLVDTAGILEPRDLIEEEAVKRSHLFIKSADLVLFMLDAATNISQEDEELAEKIDHRNMLVVINKCDLPKKLNDKMLAQAFSKQDTVRISALNREGIDVLQEKIIERVLHGKSVNTHGILVSNLRHIQSLKEARQTLQESCTTLEQGQALEVVSQGIKGAVNHLDNITGKNIDQNLLDQIFSQFCIGK